MSIRNHMLTGVDYVESPNKSGRINPKFIVMHYTGSYNARSSIRRLTTKGTNVSAHVVVDLDGTITQLVPFNIAAWHAGPSRHMGYTRLNKYSIGIEMVNIGWLRPLGNGQYQDSYGNIKHDSDFPNGMIMSPHPRVGHGTFAWPRFSDSQLKAVDNLVKELCSYYDIIDIVTHEEIDTRGWKTDPGPAFPMKMVKSHLVSDRGDDAIRFMVTATSLNVRGGPGIQFEVIKKLYKGQTVDVDAFKNEWAYIDGYGWVHSDYLVRV